MPFLTHYSAIITTTTTTTTTTITTTTVRWSVWSLSDYQGVMDECWSSVILVRQVISLSSR